MPDPISLGILTSIVAGIILEMGKAGAKYALEPTERDAWGRVFNSALQKVLESLNPTGGEQASQEVAELLKKFFAVPTNCALVSALAIGQQTQLPADLLRQRILDIRSGSWKLPFTQEELFKVLLKSTAQALNEELASGDSPLTQKVNSQRIAHLQSLAIRDHARVSDMMDSIAWLQDSFVAEKNDRGVARVARIETWLKESIARCEERWEVLGVTPNEAQAFAIDESIGRPFSAGVPSDKERLRIIIGDYGAGKSLFAERVFQAACREYLSDDTRPVPQFIQARDVVGTIRNTVAISLGQLWDQYTNGVFLIVDGLDESQAASAEGILRELRVIAESQPNCRVLLTSRPMPGYWRAQEQATIPLLSEDEAGKIIHGVQREEALFSFHFPNVISEDVRRPFFATLLHVYLRSGGHLADLSTSLSSLTQHMEDCLSQRFANYRNAFRALKSIAVATIEAGGRPVPVAVNVTLEEKDDLLRSRIISIDAGLARFTLPVLAQWFASRALEDGDLDFSTILADPVRLENWHYALTLLIERSDYQLMTKKYLAPIAELHPGFVARLVAGVISRRGNEDHTAGLTEAECGSRIRECMASLATGLDKLGFVIAPVDDCGRAKPIAIHRSGSRLTTSWLDWCTDDQGVLVVPGNVPVSDYMFQHGGLECTSAVAASHEGWPWEWAMRHLKRNLTKVLERMALPPSPDTPYCQESIWITALEIVGKGEFYEYPIPFDDIERAYSNLSSSNTERQGPDGPIRVGVQHNPIPERDILAYANGSVFGPASLSRRHRMIWPGLLKHEVDQQKQSGSTELNCPYPVRDVNLGGLRHFIWDGFSDEVLVARVKLELERAVSIYSRLVDEWFPRLAERLSMYLTLPARFVVRMETNRPGGPSMSLYLECLPSSQTSVFDVQVGPETPFFDKNTAMQQQEAAQNWRPDIAGLVRFECSSSIMHSTFGATPGVRRAYRWLCDDLAKLAWLDCRINFHS